MEELSRQANWLLRLVGLFSLLLVASTWRLWIPHHDFPQIPLFAWACPLGPLFDWGACGAIVLASAGLAAWPHAAWSRWWCGLLWIGYGSAIVLDQHRLQPWAYQFLLLAFLLGAVRSIWSVPYCRWLTVSIYAWSAWSKLDRSFLSDGGLGQQFAATLFQAVSLPRPAPGVLVVGSWCIVLGELLVAALLAMPGTRRVGVAMALVLHAALLLILGPMGMNHSSGVLLWNVFFLVLVPLLFWPWEATAEEGDCWKSPRAACGAAVVAMAIGWPSLEPLGGCDNWLAWALYSSRAERAIVLIERSAADQLPPDMQHYLRETPEGGVERLRIDLWSLESLGVPIYPENRFRLGVARALAESFELGRGLEVTLEGPAGRITGQRSSQRLRGTDEIAAAGEASWFNTRPRNNKPEAQSEGPAQGSQPQQ